MEESPYAAFYRWYIPTHLYNTDLSLELTVAALLFANEFNCKFDVEVGIVVGVVVKAAAFELVAIAFVFNAANDIDCVIVEQELMVDERECTISLLSPTTNMADCVSPPSSLVDESSRYARPWLSNIPKDGREKEIKRERKKTKTSVVWRFRIVHSHMPRVSEAE